MKSATEKSIKAEAPKRGRTAAAKTAPVAAKRSAAQVLSAAVTKETSGTQWTFLTNHAHVLVLLAQNPSLVLRQVALQVGITERAVQRVIADLEAGGFIEREKVGRQNHYRIRTSQPLRHPIEAHRTIGDLLALINDID